MGLFEDLQRSSGDFKAFSSIITQKAKNNRYLYSAIFQLTPLCNLKCKMCYARIDSREICDAGKHVMRFDEWKYYIDSVVSMGTMSLTLTGGECTLHPDFKEIYSYAYDRNLDIAIMTNGTYMPGELLDLFAQKPPASISMTLYGASPETYEKLCGDANAYFRAYQNLDVLLNMGFVVSPKYTVVKDTLDDFEKVEEYVRERGMELKYNPVLAQFDHFNRDKVDEMSINMDDFQEVTTRIWCKKSGKSPEEGKAMDLNSLEDYCKKLPGLRIAPKGIGCSAARSVCHIDWEGFMTPCVGFDAFRKDPRKTGFAECWKEMTRWADDVPLLVECQSCVHSQRCISCISQHYADVGEFGKPSPRLCWKKNHPEEAAKIEAELTAKGLITENAE